MKRHDATEPLVVSPRKAQAILDCGKTKLFELLAAGELESYLDGRCRKITMASIRARHQQKLQQSQTAA
jgi:hypothetical protein